MTLRLTEDDERLLARLAEEERISRQEAVVRAIREGSARRGHEALVVASADRVKTGYADLLERSAR